MQGSKIKEKNLFYMTNLIDQKVLKAKKKAVLFVGMSKVGKSTSFNWVAGKRIKTYLKSQQSILYQLSTTENSTKGQESAMISHEMVSCTLVPNILNIEDYSLIDMAGFQDTRDYIGTVGVAYCLKAVFQAIQQVKFIIVVSESSLIDMRMPNDLIHGFTNFFDMFKLNQLSTVSKETLFKSTSILVTRSRNPASIQKNLQSFVKQISNPKLKIKDYKVQLIKCLQSIIASSRFTYFKQATIGQQPQAPKIMQILNSSNTWSYFDIKNVKLQDLSRQNQSIIKYPFEALFDKLQGEQKQQIIRQIATRIQSYKQFKQIINSCIAPLLQNKFINQIKFDQPLFFSLVNKFIQQHDHYQSVNYIPVINAREKRQIPVKLHGLRQIIKIQQLVNHVIKNCKGSSEDLQNDNRLFRFYFRNLTEILINIYGTTADNERSIMKLSFILQRGIKQFEMLYDISSYHVSDANIKIFDSFNCIRIPEQRQIKWKYILSFQKLLSSNQNLNKYFDKNNTYDHLHAFLKEFQVDNLQKKQVFYQLFRDIKLLMAKDKRSKINEKFKKQYVPSAQTKKLQVQNGKMLVEALEEQYNLQKYLLEMAKPLNQEVVQQNVKKQKIEINIPLNQAKMKAEYMRRIQILNLLKENAIDFDKIQIAKLIAKYNRQTYSTIVIYENILANSSLSVFQRKRQLKQYAQFCYNSYKLEKAVECLEKMFDIEDNFDQKMRINKTIEDYINGSQKSKRTYLMNLRSQRIISVLQKQSIDLLARLKKQF